MLDVNTIRKDFPVLSKQVYGKPLIWMDSAATSQKPRAVIQTLVDYYEGFNANVHRGVHALSTESTAKFEQARAKVAKFINAKSVESIIWTRNTTESINLVARTWAEINIQEGDEIVLSPMEHHSNLVPWQRIAREKKASLRFLEMKPNGTLDLTNIDTVFSSKTKLLTITHESNSIGTINPVAQLIEKARSVGAKILLDGAQSVPHMPVDVGQLDCDFLAFSGHKMLGPTGIGVLYAKSEILEDMEPLFMGGEMVLEVTYDAASWNDLPMKFEAGTPNIADAIALGTAIDYLDAIGMKNIREHEINMTNYALEKFSALNDIQVFGPLSPELRGGIISFHTPDVHPHDLGTILDREGIAIRTGHHCTMPLVRSLGVAATARASFYLYNSTDEIDILVEALEQAVRYFKDGAR